MEITEFKIGPFVHAKYDDYPYDAFDPFTMLSRESYPTRRIYDHPAGHAFYGKPSYAEYYLGGELVFKHYYFFTVDGDGIAQQKKIERSFIKLDGSESERILVHFKEIDMTDPDSEDSAEAISELEMTRKRIYSKVKASLIGILKAGLNQNLNQVKATVSPFLSDYSQEINNWIDVGSSEWSDALAALDINNLNNHLWLSIVVSPGVTVRDFIINKINP